MVCPYCHGDLAVSNSRPQKSRNQTWRRRPCKACGAVFTSIEAIELSQTIAVSYGSESASAPAGQPARRTIPDLQPFDRDRLFVSLHASLRHRPSAIGDARALSETIIGYITSLAKSGHISSRTIRQTALNTLQRFDQAAATHYAAFHPQK